MLKRAINRVLVANRGEIAIRIFRACSELGIDTVAIYSEEDKKALFRTKADQSYQVGKGKAPVEAYLSMDEIIKLAKSKYVDAIHPGYGFLAENSEFAQKCEAAGLIFVGPSHDMMDRLGDKIKSKLVAIEVGVSIIPGIEKPITSGKEAIEFAQRCGYPLMLKAAAGGGGRGMRIVRQESDLVSEFNNAQSEARKAFGIDTIFMERYLENPKHIEVQVLGDNYGNIVHLYERDCSVQRRHQKVIEFTPALSLTDKQRGMICEDALKIARAVNYRSAGTVEFLVDASGQHYFIEMNPRIQVEHTVTEMVTGIDIVQSQLLIAQGYPLDSDEVNIKGQDSVRPRGVSIQCRITTEDPINDFAPDTGVIDVYRSGSGFGIRLDSGNAFTGAMITPYYDSLLVKLTSLGRTFDDARKRSLRALDELKISGVKTNIGFLINVLNHPVFTAGNADTGFITDNPELLNIKASANTELKLLRFLGDKNVNETKNNKPAFSMPMIPDIAAPAPSGTKQILDENGPEYLSKWILEQKQLLLTETTFRDAQQSLIATRMRTADMERIAPALAVLGKDIFSLEMWGGATFDVAYRFLKEDPWERLTTLRKRVPNILFQMLFRGANAVGYKNYPDNVIKKFIKEAAAAGIDIFRIFDSLNWLEGMETALDEVLNQGKIAEACICYTGDILDFSKEKYNLEYYIKMAKELEKRGTHILCIKDMSGLLKPMAAYKLITALKNEVAIPVQLHTHDTSGNGIASIMMASMAGVDVVDSAFSSMSGLTSQPSLNSIIAALENTDRATGISLDDMQMLADYWSDIRPIYAGFESGLKSGTTEIYKYEIPGGQYSNLKPQVESFGLGHKFQEVKEMFKTVNEMLGDIVKVTPSSKAVGDMSIFMVQNDLTPENIYEKAADIDFPDSIVSYFEGMMGQPEGGFPERLQKLILKDKQPITCRPGELLPPEDFDSIRDYLSDKFSYEPTERDIISYALYPKVFEEYLVDIEKNGSFRFMGSDIFFHGLNEEETGEIKLAAGKRAIVKLIEVRGVDDEGNRTLIFEVNGNHRAVTIKDKSALIQTTSKPSVLFAKEGDQSEVGANIPGCILKVLVAEGDSVEFKQPIAIIEAMKMQTNIIATQAGTVEKIFITEGQSVRSGELIARIK